MNRRRTWLAGLCLAVFFLGLGLSLAAPRRSRSRAAEPPAAQARAKRAVETSAPGKYDSPQAVYRTYRAALAAKDWRAEYECYAPDRQAWFSFAIVGMAEDLEFETDLALRVELALEKHGLEIDTIRKLRYAMEQEQFTEGFQREAAKGDGAKAAEPFAWYDRALARWKKEIMPRVRDMPGLIAELSPAIREGAKREECSILGKTVESMESTAYGYLRELRVEGNSARGVVRAKLLRGTWMNPEEMVELQEAVFAAEENEEVDDGSAKISLAEYTEDMRSFIKLAGAEIKQFAARARAPRTIYVRLPTGDGLVQPNTGDPADYDFDIDDNVDWTQHGMEPDAVFWDRRGGRKYADETITFKKIDGRWLINELGGPVIARE